MTSDKTLEEGIFTDFEGRMSYSDYLCLDKVLAAQRPVSDSHDELLFITIHQATELWMKLMRHEVLGATRSIAADDLQPAFKMLARVSRIQAQIIQSWDILSTLTPADYLAFRDRLGQASGFQSAGYRLLEFALGNRDRSLLAPFRHDTAMHAELAAALAAPSIYDEAVHCLARSGFEIAETVLARDRTQTWQEDRTVLDAWRQVYRDVDRHWDLYQLAEKLVDVEDWFQQWRFRHLKTVERIIGMRRGTGGSAGVTYLKKALDFAFFPELWALRTEL
ncbi:tryptophan 2,3-dioxygenase [Marinibaculum pumilum]|uniref:Tryptophan 2,3-dioxygenase n=1 Tax=Marinibaculum pumilum TaxID=1766165 RepID=A0ABV7KV92_9PROT